MENTNSSSPIFIHSLFRAGSTYIFNVFRRSGDQYWCYQEPLNEHIIYARSEPEKLLMVHKQTAEILRHPELEKPYFYEVYVISEDVAKLFRKSFSYDSYFSLEKDEAFALRQYIDLLTTKSQGRPVLQCCRTAGRIEYLKSEFNGIHVFLWRNPWDQWWSYRIGFDTNNLLILNAHTLPDFLRSIKDEINCPEFHNSNLFLEYDFFRRIRLSAQDSYTVFFGLWCYAMIEALPLCDFFINIDILSESKQYKAQVLNQFSQAGVDVSNLDFSDCNVPIGIYSSTDASFFEPIENSVYVLLAENGYSNAQIENIKNIRSRFLPKEGEAINLVETVSRDAMRARKIARDLQDELSVFSENIRRGEDSLLELNRSFVELNRSFEAALFDEHEFAYQWWSIAHRLQQEIAVIHRSPLWRLAAPLRRLKQSISRLNLFSNVITLLNTQGKQFSRRIVQWGVTAVAKQPVIRANMLSFLNRNPNLERRIRKLIARYRTAAFTTTQNTSSWTAIEDLPNSDLSILNRRIHIDAKSPDNVFQAIAMEVTLSSEAQMLLSQLKGN